MLGLQGEKDKAQGIVNDLQQQVNQLLAQARTGTPHSGSCYGQVDHGNDQNCMQAPPGHECGWWGGGDEDEEEEESDGGGIEEGEEQPRVIEQVVLHLKEQHKDEVANLLRMKEEDRARSEKEIVEWKDKVEKGQRDLIAEVRVSTETQTFLNTALRIARDNNIMMLIYQVPRSIT